MTKSVWHAVSFQNIYISMRADAGRGQYGMWYRFYHVMYTLSYFQKERPGKENDKEFQVGVRYSYSHVEMGISRNVW